MRISALSTDSTRPSLTAAATGMPRTGSYGRLPSKMTANVHSFGVAQPIALRQADRHRPDPRLASCHSVIRWCSGSVMSGLPACGSARRSRWPRPTLHPVRGAILVRQGKGGKRREVGMDRWAWEQLEPWIELRKTLPVGAFLLHPARIHARPAVRTRKHPGPTAPHRCRGRGQATVRSTSTPARPRGRDVSRRSAVSGHPTATRSCRLRSHLRVPARHRQHRDHPQRSRTADAYDPSDCKARPQPVEAGTIHETGRGPRGRRPTSP